MPPSGIQTSNQEPKTKSNESRRKNPQEQKNSNLEASSSRGTEEPKGTASEKLTSSEIDKSKSKTRDDLKSESQDSKRQTAEKTKTEDIEVSKPRASKDAASGSVGESRDEDAEKSRRPLREQSSRGGYEATPRPRLVQRGSSSGSKDQSARSSEGKKPVKERSQSMSHCAKQEADGHPAKTPLETEDVAKSSKSRVPSSGKGHRAVKRVRNQSANKATANSVEELALLASHFGGLLQESDDLDYFADKRMPGSCEWFLDEPVLAQLLQDPKHSQVLWCTGRPGCGKSVFTSSVINQLHESDAKCAFHFFRFGCETQNELGSLLVSAAYQFAGLIPEYRSCLNRMFEQGLSIQKSAPRLIWQKLFVTTLFKMDLSAPLYIIVDGLDECDSSPLLLKLLGDVAKAKAKLCVLVASRKTQSLSTAFDKLAKLTKVEMLSLDDVDEDLRMFVEEEMDAMRGEQSFKDRISERILAKADGNFLWASLVIKEVLQCHTETEIEEALREIPQDLEELYERMDGTLARTSRPADHALARTILMWVVCSRHRLSLEQLSDALKPDYDEVLDLKLTVSQVCGEFVILEANGTVAMVHATARDFLVEKKNLNLHIPAAESHQKIYAKCLSELMASSSKIQMGQAKPRSFLSYAATSWAYHLNLASTYLDQESLVLLAQFFRGPAVLSWIYLLSMSGQLGVLIHSSKIMANFLKHVDRLDADRSPLTHRLQEKDSLSLWTVDLMKLIGKFGCYLKTQPKSIYKLVPAFCPPTSAMHKTFCAKAQQSYLSVSGISNPSWDDCLAKLTIPNKCLPIAITSINKRFAILTSDGTVHLYHSRTLEEGRRFKHGERVLAWSFNQSGEKLVTYGFVRTIVWNVASGLQLFYITNPSTAKAMGIGFTSNDESIITCSDDQSVRWVTPGSAEANWQVLENVFGSDELDLDQHNSPRCVAFNALCSQLAVGYRGSALCVWSVDEPRPCLVGRCERQGSASQPANGSFVNTQTICWNTVTGHVMGLYNDGCVFKWHPFDGDYIEAKASGADVKCSPDGKIFVTSSVDGSLRVWDFQHFSPIYQLSYPGSVTDLAIDPDERRIYDIRESFCNIWEPNALLRQWETEEKASDANSTRESSTHVSAYSEASSDPFEPLTALAVDTTSFNFASGNDDGVVKYYSRDGELIGELSQTFMTVEHICWSDNGTCIAFSDLSRRVIVKDVDPIHPTAAAASLLTVKVDDPIKQLLLSPLGHFLLVSTDSCLTIWSVQEKKVVSSRPQTAWYYWKNSPSNPDQLIGFGYSDLQISMWEGMGTIWQLTIDRSGVDGFSERHGVHAMFPKPTAQSRVADGEAEHAVDKVVFTLDGSMALIETSQCSASHAREKQFMFVAVDADSLVAALGSSSMIIQPKLLAPELVSRLALPLGFVVTDPIKPVRHKSFAATTPTSADPTRRSFLAPSQNLSATHSTNANSWRTSSSTFLSVSGEANLDTADEHVLAFLDRDHWVCTYVFADGRPGKVRRHHFLPRDWVTMDCLELAVMRRDGTLLCPRNGEVAMVTNGLKEECMD